MDMLICSEEAEYLAGGGLKMREAMGRIATELVAMVVT